MHVIQDSCNEVYFNHIFDSNAIDEDKKKDVNWDSHIASSPIPQSTFFKEVHCLILASSQRKLRG